MSSLATLDPRSAMDSLYDDWSFSIVRFRVSDHAKVHVAELEQIGEQWWAVFRQEKKLQEAVVGAQRRVFEADAALNRRALRIAAILKTELGYEPGSAEWVRFWGSQTPSQFIRPLLGEQLEAQGGWVQSLVDSVHVVLKEQGKLLEGEVVEAEAAKKAESLAEGALKDFRVTGGKRQFVDQFNGWRKSKLGELSKFQHDHPELNLPSDWAESFFKAYSPPREMSDKVLAEKIDAAQAEVRRLEAIRDQRRENANKEEELRQEAAKKTLEAEIAAHKATAAKAAAEAAALQAELDKLLKAEKPPEPDTQADPDKPDPDKPTE